MQALANTLRETSNWVSLQVDWRNAFNCMDRTTFLLAAATRSTTLYNYLHYAYATPAPLFVGGTRLVSQCGTHQGCPLGPIGFYLGLASMTERLHKEAGLLWGVWYLDDGVLVGDPVCIQQALTYLETAGQEIGLTLNRVKCVLWGPGASAVTEAASLITRNWSPGEAITVLGITVDKPGCIFQLGEA